MNVHIRWIKQQIAKAERDIEDAQERLNTWKTALKLAEQEEMTSSHSAASRGGQSQKTPPKSRARKVVDRVIELIREEGPAKASELEEWLTEMDVITTANSINTSLNRFRGALFEKNANGEWYLLENQKKEDKKNKDDIPF